MRSNFIAACFIFSCFESIAKPLHNQPLPISTYLSSILLENTFSIKINEAATDIICFKGNLGTILISDTTYFHEQAYGFVNELTGKITKTIETENNKYIAIGTANKRGFIARMYEDGQIDKLNTPYPITGEVTFTDIISDGDSYIVSGICDKCFGNTNSSRGFFIRVNKEFNTFSNLTYLQSVIDTNVYSGVKIVKDENALYTTFSGSLGGFGTRAHITKHSLIDFTLQWKVQFNESFFSEPNFIEFVEEKLVISTQGFDSNVILYVNKDGSLNHVSRFSPGKNSLVIMGNENKLMAIQRATSTKIYLLNSNDIIVDSLNIPNDDLLFNDFDIEKIDENTVLMVKAHKSNNELPYIRYYDALYHIDSKDKLSILKKQWLPENGTTNRNINHILKTSRGYLLSGSRYDGTFRPFIIQAQSTPISMQAPTDFYNSDVCNDNDLIHDRVQFTRGATLPHITNDVVYATKQNFKSELEDLWLDIYRPYDHYAQNSNHHRPALIYCAGGGYLGMSENTSTALMQAAERGMIGIAVKYRTGIHPNFTTDSLDTYAPYFLKASYRAQQDLIDAVRYVFNNAEKHHIDTSQIFLMGHSAGGNMVLNYAHVDESNYEQQWINDLGNLDKPKKLRAIIPYAAPFNQLNFGMEEPASYIDVNEDTPMYFIHGTCDSTALYVKGNILDPNSNSSIGAYTLSCIKQKLKQSHVLHTIIGGDHTLASAENEVFESMFQWMKDQVICGTPDILTCKTTTAPNIEPCSLIDSCPDCFEVNTHEEEIFKVNVIPTLAFNYIIIKSSSKLKNIQILNQNGITLVSINNNLGEPIDISQFGSGFYIVVCTSDNGERIIKKVIVTK